MPTVEERLSRMENRLIRYRLTSYGLAVIVAAGLLMGASRGDSKERRNGHTVRTNRLEIVNDKGTTVLLLEADAAGGRLALCDLSGQQVVQAWSSAAGGVLAVGPRTNKPLVTMQCTKEGGQMVINNDLTTPSIRIDGREFGGQIDVLNHLSKTVVSTAAGGTNGGRLAVFNQTGQCVFTALATPLQGQLHLGDNEGKPIWRAP